MVIKMEKSNIGKILPKEELRLTLHPLEFSNDN